ncbi:hypothetical protein F443_12627 [Phytophthora nicotianae P1569]|uniref:DUF6818 domain-containing protein n=1 Tax=Phytophthora nicotianae P1569 TaxID=1317065 RepID=V9ESH1_PHYNI|nr:hypothetical protein F443_12627 [Phytophthora nicotianae P1569]
MAKLTGSTNYKFTEVQRLLSLVAKFLPLGKDEWERLASSYNSNRGRGIAEQDYESLRRKFKMLPKRSSKVSTIRPVLRRWTTEPTLMLKRRKRHPQATPRPPPGSDGSTQRQLRSAGLSKPYHSQILHVEEPEKSSVGRSRRTAESKGYISAPNRLGGGNLAAFRETIDRKRGADDDDDLHEASYAKSDLENTSGAMGINIVELMILMREDTERRDEVRRAEEEQRRCDDILAREMRYNAEKKKAEERRRQEKLETEERSRRDKEEACARSQELMPFISALVKKE